MDDAEHTFILDALPFVKKNKTKEKIKNIVKRKSVFGKMLFNSVQFHAILHP